MAKDKDKLATARKRFAQAESYWKPLHDKSNKDLVMTFSDDQWEPDIKDSRINSGLPVITDNRLHTEVQQVTNRARQERPQPKVSPGDDEATREVAEVLEGHLRHIQYASQADVAYDGGEEYSAACGIGFFRITSEYVNPKSFDQEPRIRRILDPMTVYFDPSCEEPDFSDARWCFVRKRMTHEEYKEEYGERVSPTDFEGEGLKDWGDSAFVWVAEYWEVDFKKRNLYRLEAGGVAFEDEFQDGDVPTGEPREVKDPEISFCQIDGLRVLPGTETAWLGRWIPIIPVLGKEVVIKGKRELISLVRYSHGRQKMLNAAESGMVEAIGLGLKAPVIGFKGQFKDKKWRDANTTRYAYLEADYPSNWPAGTPPPLPQRNAFEAPIQALAAVMMQQIDSIKAGFGYIDNITRPSQADISGVGVQRRMAQRDLTNFHFADNLSRAQWHAARVIIDLDVKLTDTPRVWNTRKVSGESGKAIVTVRGEDGQPQLLAGKEDELHHLLDIGQYEITVSTEPSYNTKREEEQGVLLQALQADPMLWATFADVLFRIMGYPDLEERAKMILPPQIQQAMAGEGQQIPPAIQAQLASLMQQNGALKQGLQQLVQVIKTKQVEQQGRLAVEKVKTAGQLMVETTKHQHEFSLAHNEDVMEAIQHVMTLLHESELGSTPGPGMGNNAQPQPAGPGVPAQ